MLSSYSHFLFVFEKMKTARDEVFGRIQRYRVAPRNVVIQSNYNRATLQGR